MLSIKTKVVGLSMASSMGFKVTPWYGRAYRLLHGSWNEIMAVVLVTMNGRMLLYEMSMLGLVLD